MISAPIEPPEEKHFSLSRADLPKELRERAETILSREAATLDALKTAGGLYRTSEGRLLLRDQQSVLLFFLAAGEPDKAEALFAAVCRSFRRSRFLTPCFDPETGNGPREKRYPETDAALSAAECFLALADAGDPDALMKRYSDLVLYAVTVLRDGIVGYRLPFAGHEKELTGLPFPSRFHASARATAEFIHVLKTLSRLFPNEKKIASVALLAKETENRFSDFFRGEHGYFEDSVLPARSHPSCIYGVCPFCGLRGRGIYEGWLLKKGGWYRCEICCTDRFEPNLPKMPYDPPPRLGKSLPAFLAALGFTDAETEKGIQALTKRIPALSLSDAALLLPFSGPSFLPLVIHLLDGMEEKESIPELSSADVGSLAFAAASLLRMFGNDGTGQSAAGAKNGNRSG